MYLLDFREQVIARMVIPCGNYARIRACYAHTGPASICMKIRVEYDNHNTMEEMMSDGDLRNTVLACESDDCQSDCYCGEHSDGRFFFQYTRKGSWRVMCAECVTREVQDGANVLEFVPPDIEFDNPRPGSGANKRQKTEQSTSQDEE